MNIRHTRGVTLDFETKPLTNIEFRKTCDLRRIARNEGEMAMSTARADAVDGRVVDVYIDRGVREMFRCMESMKILLQCVVLRCNVLQATYCTVAPYQVRDLPVDHSKLSACQICQLARLMILAATHCNALHHTVTLQRIAPSCTTA